MNRRLGHRLTIAEYHMEEQKPKISVLARRYSISCSTLQRYIKEIMMSGSQYEKCRSRKQLKLKKTSNKTYIGPFQEKRKFLVKLIPPSI